MPPEDLHDELLHAFFKARLRYADGALEQEFRAHVRIDALRARIEGVTGTQYKIGHFVIFRHALRVDGAQRKSARLERTKYDVRVFRQAENRFERFHVLLQRACEFAAQKISVGHFRHAHQPPIHIWL